MLFSRKKINPYKETLYAIYHAKNGISRIEALIDRINARRRKMLEIAREKGLDLVYTFVATPNVESQRVLEKNDFKRAGVIRDYVRNVFGEKFDAYIYFKKL